MASRFERRFELVYAPDFVRQIRSIATAYHAAIRKAIEAQLTHQANQQTRNRKPLLRPVPFGAEWELRCGPGNRFRVFYNVDELHQQVIVLAVGVKERSRLYIDGEEVGW